MRKFLIAGAVLIGMFAASPAAQAVTINVNTTEDTFNAGGTTCSLREAITAAQTDTAKGGCTAGSGADDIKLKTGQYDITRAGTNEDANVTGDFDIAGTGTLTISPQNQTTDKVVVNGNGLDRVFNQTGNNSLSIKNLQVKGGLLTGIGYDGAGILNSVGSLNLEDVTVSASSTESQGGGVAVYSNLSAVNSTISGNKADGAGGGLYVTGGGIATVKDSTITDNTADAEANGNGDGGGFRNSVSSVSFFNVIDAGNKDLSPLDADKSPDCSSDSPTYAPRYVLTNQAISTTKCLVLFDPGTSIVTPDAKIGPLNPNLGQTPVHPLLEGSPAIGAGGTAAPDTCISSDQLGNPRTPKCDIGAVQFIKDAGKANLLIEKTSPAKKKVKRGKTLKVKVSVRNGGTGDAAGVKVCLALKVKSARKALKIKGPKCKTIGAVAIGALKTAAFKVSARKGAKKKSFSVTSSVVGTGLTKVTRAFKVKVK